jgi:hypothetical protein
MSNDMSPLVLPWNMHAPSVFISLLTYMSNILQVHGKATNFRQTCTIIVPALSLAPGLQRHPEEGHEHVFHSSSSRVQGCMPGTSGLVLTDSTLQGEPVLKPSTCEVPWCMRERCRACSSWHSLASNSMSWLSLPIAPGRCVMEAISEMIRCRRLLRAPSATGNAAKRQRLIVRRVSELSRLRASGSSNGGPLKCSCEKLRSRRRRRLPSMLA